MVKTYHIHPAIGIARLGDSPTSFCLSPEKPGALPIQCDAQGNADLSPDGTRELTIAKFKDAEGRIKRQGARFQIFVHDEQDVKGRRLRLGDRIEGGGNNGTLVDIEWRVHLANKKAAWYSFQQLEGEHGYRPDHPLRNPDITDAEARQRLIIDPGPRTVDCGDRRRASFNKDPDADYAQTFPPELNPNGIETLGDIMTNREGQLIVLGGHGRSGSYKTGMGQPRIDHYANNDGWFDDTSDGPVMARLKMYVDSIDAYRYLDVAGPAWVIAAYPAYVPQILDQVTTDDVVHDMGIREFATDTGIYGLEGSFDNPQIVDTSDPEALALWRAQELQWNPDYLPWFHRDIWPIISRPWYYTWLANVLSQSNFPHDQTERGTFYKELLGRPPTVDLNRVEEMLARESTEAHFRKWVNLSRSREGKDPIEDFEDWPESDRDRAKSMFHSALQTRLIAFVRDDPYKKNRRYIYNVLRQAGEENTFRELGRPHSRTANAPLMPLLAGDNPISNTLPSKFLRLTDYQLFILRQWMEGKFINEAKMATARERLPPGMGESGHELDRGVLSNLCGGAFCPGAEVGWLIRNPSIYTEPYRIKAAPRFAEFGQTAASAYKTPGQSFDDQIDALNAQTDLSVGLEPGDLTKQMALPWQADFNECSMQDIDVTYEAWNDLYPDSENDARLKRTMRTWETMWWPAHRPLETLEVVSFQGGQPNYQWLGWSRGIPQTNAGDLKMVTAWKDLGFVIENPYLSQAQLEKDHTTDLPRYISVERKDAEPT
ncbi:LodA/GoxA family CTQ-dependent oxidase [Sulfidibacter corallicola]|uniref:LodA/GoxA family CTQ-dependent oxidase n=1 Tax=Sulfidibacter corallicola TaxID=2818388 RepID=A0A8A4TWB8_SULCO|nr:LodA/GoxA family CTQ-dependent oxidase [Sulfidibacter corallicola]QTD54256.1 LodA/GoxA family CTQ-dependent oxidase [Sulfidibacter corallicola]